MSIPSSNPPRTWQAQIAEALKTTTQAELGRRLGVDSQTIYRWSKGHNPRMSMLPRLQALLERGVQKQHGMTTEQWLLGRDELLARYRLAREVWVMKSGKSLLSEEDTEAKIVLKDIVEENFRIINDGGDPLQQKTINFLVADANTTKGIHEILKNASDDLLAEVESSEFLKKIGVQHLDNLEKRKAEALAFHGLRPSVSIDTSFGAAIGVIESLRDFVLNTSEIDNDSDLAKCCSNTIRLYTINNIIEMWALNLGFSGLAWVYLRYDDPPSEPLSSLKHEILLEVDVREATTSPNGTIQSNPRRIWVRLRDQAIIEQLARIQEVLHAAEVRGAVKLKGDD